MDSRIPQVTMDIQNIEHISSYETNFVYENELTWDFIACVICIFVSC